MDRMYYILNVNVTTTNIVKIDKLYALLINEGSLILLEFKIYKHIKYPFVV